MLISIVIPVYKVEEYIERCIQSVISQDYQGDLECLLIDDCTPDNSCAIIGNILDKYDGPIKFRLLHHEKNRGLSAARNTGIDNAQGDYIYFLDSDDYITADCISRLAAPLVERNYDIVIGNYSVIGSDEDFPTFRLGDTSLNNNNDIIESYTRYDWYMMAWNKLCNVSFIKKHALYFKEGLIHEDELWSFQFACRANSLRSVHASTYYYCIREESIITSVEEFERLQRTMMLLGLMKDYLVHSKLSNCRYNNFLFDRYARIKNHLVKNISRGIKFDSDLLRTYVDMGAKIGYIVSVKGRLINFLIINSRSRWATKALIAIHKRLVVSHIN